ncbi:CBS domain-containing protein CBSX5 [Neltuma alba]|uniref:CBS domain-containing protein CBSX5 n=1 Tax=Neltuma alba TaxID=207710 RepID=UPI0010A4030E|nr:CBS domain-containing protein CBSX5-like [Prosopis alba]
MAVTLLSNEVLDLCLGKPALRSLSVTDTVADALCVLKRLGDSCISVWSCHHSSESVDSTNRNVEGGAAAAAADCQCIGKVCMVDIICFICQPENLLSPAQALQSPISVLIPKTSLLVRHLDPNARLLDAIDLILEGAQNLVIPIPEPKSGRKKLLEKKSSLDPTFHNNDRRYCWLTQEDVIRYLLNSIGLFSPTHSEPINSLGVIDTKNLLTVNYDDPASSALSLIEESLIRQSSVAIVNPEGQLIGEISPFHLNSCNETAAAAMATLSAGDLMAYIDCGGPPDDLVQLVKERLEEQNLMGTLELMEEESGPSLTSWSSFTSTSSDEDGLSSGKNGKHGGYSARVVRRSEGTVCYPWSSLVAVMIQALAHRVSYVWVVDEDGTLTGIVTFSAMLKVFREHFKVMG